MRLFVAINFNDEMKKGLAGVTETLRVNAVKGNFTLTDNLHLTVEFIGETRNAAGAIRAIETVECEAFTLKTTGPLFRRRAGLLAGRRAERRLNRAV